MSVFLTEETRVVVQGITGSEGSFHTQQMIEYGTRVVAGVTPRKGGQAFNDSVPIFNTVQQAVDQTGANASVIFVPPAFAAIWPPLHSPEERRCREDASTQRKTAQRDRPALQALAARRRPRHNPEAPPFLPETTIPDQPVLWHRPARQP